ncbi:MAG TPA: YiaA/YiaB family inner membrane protein [Thiolinea sp.]|nr:YiaA/YiaB family inner membrane protein [Thiolinea sp.]
MNPQEIMIQGNSAGWLLFVKLSFGVSLAAMLAFIFFMEGSLLTKGYLALNGLFIVSSTIMVSKTLRDEYENKKLINRISEARTNKILQQYED